MYVKIRRHQHTRIHAHTGPRRHTRAPAETLACIAIGDQNRLEEPSFFACSRPTAPKGSLVCPHITHSNHSPYPPSSVRASYEIRLFRNYLKRCAAEHSLPTLDNNSVFCIGLLRWAKLPMNNRIYVTFEFNLSGSHSSDRWRLKLNDNFGPSEGATPLPTPADFAVPIVPWTVPPNGDPSPEADAILSKLVTDLLKTPSPSGNNWWTADELLLGMDMGPAQIERGTLLTNYLHSWRGYTYPIQDRDIHRECAQD